MTIFYVTSPIISHKQYDSTLLARFSGLHQDHIGKLYDCGKPHDKRQREEWSHSSVAHQDQFSHEDSMLVTLSLSYLAQVFPETLAILQQVSPLWNIPRARNSPSRNYQKVSPPSLYSTSVLLELLLVKDSLQLQWSNNLCHRSCCLLFCSELARMSPSPPRFSRVSRRASSHHPARMNDHSRSPSQPDPFRMGLYHVVMFHQHPQHTSPPQLAPSGMALFLLTPPQQSGSSQRRHFPHKESSPVASKRSYHSSETGSPRPSTSW